MTGLSIAVPRCGHFVRGSRELWVFVLDNLLVRTLGRLAFVGPHHGTARIADTGWSPKTPTSFKTVENSTPVRS
jgi:hypothetical protein